MQSSTKKRIAYLCHIDWDWIKQRPQFIAEGLLPYYDVDIIYMPISLRRNRHLLKENRRPALRLKKLMKFPFSGRSRIMRHLQKGYNLLSSNISSYDIIWICSPEVLYRIDLPTDQDKILIYDCMDDMIENHPMPVFKRELLAMEKELINRADIVFVSSVSLHHKMLSRGAHAGKLVTVHNGTNLPFAWRSGDRESEKKTDVFTVVYFGTISTWIDVEMLLKLLHDKELPTLTIKLIGPSEIDLPHHERLIHVGHVKHEELSVQVSDGDLFILPFILNPITVSVDPVKLYEYIAFNGNIAARYYPELERYREFVHFYDDYKELKSIVRALMHDHSIKYRPERAEAFLLQNSWSVRISNMVEKMRTVLESRG